ncbi:cytochrome P450 98A3 [Coprinopsis marcescibilis]|uniref:Cytochrome P450 98A3 n=1 Tax=Coprinopsis marcescibilis TaxID=230819 RepID=A0A5C3KE50_COPMA|nr:cytochrome P450 98A3 [Coprinopsis marcescibilis]
MDHTRVVLHYGWPLVAALVLAGLGAKLTFGHRKRNPKGLPLPPGPKGLPVIGNLLQIPQVKPWLVYDQWAHKYGDVIYVEAIGQPIILLNTMAATLPLLEKKGMNYSDRLYLPTFKIMKLDWSLALLNYGPEWRAHRRAFHQSLSPTMIPPYHALIEEECLVFLRNLLTNPRDFAGHTRYYFGSVLMRVSYGVTDFEFNRQLINDAEVVLRAFSSAVVPGRMLVNNFPFLRHVPDWFPGTGWKQVCNEVGRLNDRVVNKGFNEAQSRYRNETSQSDHPSIVGGLLEELPPETDPTYAEREYIVRCVAAQSYTAGSDTTLTASLALFAALALHPAVQEKAQAELDSVLGAERLPIAKDIEKLPYIQAIAKEIVRWYTVVPLGVPHLSKEDDEYDGYFIPKGTLIQVNIWYVSIMHDPENYDDPHEFRPERFLKNGKIDPSVMDPETAIFGFGRRICPGRHLSNASFGVMLASVLAVFHFGIPKDEAGREKKLKLVMGSDMIA